MTCKTKELSKYNFLKALLALTTMSGSYVKTESGRIHYRKRKGLAARKREEISLMKSPEYGHFMKKPIK